MSTAQPAYIDGLPTQSRCVPPWTCGFGSCCANASCAKTISVFDKGACLLGKAGRAIFYAQWERANPPLHRWLRTQCQALARQLRSEGQPWLLQSEPESETVWD